VKRDLSKYYLLFLYVGTPKGAMMTNANMNSELAALQMQYQVCILKLEQLQEFLHLTVFNYLF